MSAVAAAASFPMPELPDDWQTTVKRNRRGGFTARAYYVGHRGLGPQLVCKLSRLHETDARREIRSLVWDAETMGLAAEADPEPTLCYHHLLYALRRPVAPLLALRLRLRLQVKS